MGRPFLARGKGCVHGFATALAWAKYGRPFRPCAGDAVLLLTGNASPLERPECTVSRPRRSTPRSAARGTIPNRAITRHGWRRTIGPPDRGHQSARRFSHNWPMLSKEWLPYWAPSSETGSVCRPFSGSVPAVRRPQRFMHTDT